MQKTYFVHNFVKTITKGGDINGAYVKLPYRNFMIVLPSYFVILSIVIIFGLIYTNVFQTNILQNMHQLVNGTNTKDEGDDESDDDESDDEAEKAIKV